MNFFLSRMKKNIVLVAGVLCLSVSLYAQTTTSTVRLNDSNGGNASLSRGYDGINLGMPYQTVYDALINSPSLGYRGKPDVSLSPGRDEKIIEARGGRYVKRGIFQFRDDKLFTIILEFNSDHLDFYGLYSSFLTRFGESKTLSPDAVIWENAEIRIILEKPLSIKYIDKIVMEKLEKDAGIQEAVQERSRSEFMKRL